MKKAIQFFLGLVIVGLIYVIATLIHNPLSFEKEMKARNAVQFFATKESFEKSTTEAKFLTNKYPEISYDSPENADVGYIYVKI